MSEPRNDEPGGATAGGSATDGRGTGSSLTDAVVAALANVVSTPMGETRSDSRGGASDETLSEASPPTEASPSPPSSDETLSEGSPLGVATLPEVAVPNRTDDATLSEASSHGDVEAPSSEAESPSASPAEPEGVSNAAPSIAAAIDAATAEVSGDSETPGEGGPGTSTETSEEGAEVERPVPEGITVEYFGKTDVGLVREHNEDNFVVVDLSKQLRGLGDNPSILRTTLGDRGLVLAVCDGMGGAAAGEVASQMAVDTISEVMLAGAPPRDRDQLARRLVRAVEEAGDRIYSAAKLDRSRRGMGTTATVAALVDSTLFVGQVGDSRAYVLRGDQFALITKDQSLVNQLIEAGQLTEEEAEAFEHSNIILQALGTTDEVAVDLTFLELRRGDRLLMCSDGLSGLVHAELMKDVLRTHRDLDQAAQQLIGMANAGGGHDNITVILAEFDGTGLREATADARVAYQQYPLPSEGPADVDVLPVRAVTLKSGGQKPGADVKSGVAREVEDEIPTTSSRTWIIGVVLLVVLIVGAMMVVVCDDGQNVRAEAPASETRVTIANTRRRGEAVVPVEARVTVRTDVEGGVLFVDGARRPGRVHGETTVALPPGERRLELRVGEVRVAERTVTLTETGHEIVELRMPTGAAGQRELDVAADHDDGERTDAVPMAPEPGVL